MDKEYNQTIRWRRNTWLITVKRFQPIFWENINWNNIPLSIKIEWTFKNIYSIWWWSGEMDTYILVQLINCYRLSGEHLKFFFWEPQRSSCLWPHSFLPRNIFCGFSKNFKVIHTKRFLYKYSRIFLLWKILYQNKDTENITNLYVPIIQFQQLVIFS